VYKDQYDIFLNENSGRRVYSFAVKTSTKREVGTQVFKLGDWNNVYRIVKLQAVEPRYLIQLGDDRKTQKWMITEDLEFDLSMNDQVRY
jgi:hypothetical protein